jgi:hypothetical protein
MSMDSFPAENMRFQPDADSYSTVSLSSEMARVESGQTRWSTKAAMWSSYWKRGTASSGWCSSSAREIRPDFRASKIGSRPPWTRLCTSAEMNTVLPERERPLTPSRSDGENSPAARSAMVPTAMRASSVMVVNAGKVNAFGCRPPI